MTCVVVVLVFLLVYENVFRIRESCENAVIDAVQ
jgi:hypothetical protein